MFPFVAEMIQKTENANFKIVTFLHSNSLNICPENSNLGKNQRVFTFHC